MIRDLISSTMVNGPLASTPSSSAVILADSTGGVKSGYRGRLRQPGTATRPGTVCVSPHLMETDDKVKPRRTRSHSSIRSFSNTIQRVRQCPVIPVPSREDYRVSAFPQRHATHQVDKGVLYRPGSDPPRDGSVSQDTFAFHERLGRSVRLASIGRDQPPLATISLQRTTTPLSGSGGGYVVPEAITPAG